MTMNSEIEIGKIEKLILKKMFFDNPSRPDYYKFSSVYKFFDYKVYEEKEIRNALNKLIENKLIEEENGCFNLTRTSYLKLRQKYKLILLLSDRRSSLYIPVLVGFMATFISLLSSDNIFSFKKSDSKTEKKDIELRLDIIEKHMSEIDKAYDNKSLAIDSVSFSNEIIGLKKDFKDLSSNLYSLNALLQDNPKRFVEISTINKDLEKLKEQIDSNNDSLRREVDRISSYNNTLIVFMITFLVAYIGIGIFTNLSRKKDIA